MGQEYARYEDINKDQLQEDIEEIKKNLNHQLTAPVKWTQSVKNMIADGATEFIECGPGKVLQGLVKKINPDVEARSLL